MKKILILFIAVCTFATAFSQNNEEARRVILGEKKGSGSTTQDPRDVVYGEDRRVYDERDSRNNSSQVEEINRDYDRKIQSIRDNPYLSASEKERAIRQLESDRKKRIREVNKSYNDKKRDRDDDDDKKYKKNKKAKKNNGKHLGWEKGKGNQKKNKRN